MIKTPQTMHDLKIRVLTLGETIDFLEEYKDEKNISATLDFLNGEYEKYFLEFERLKAIGDFDPDDRYNSIFDILHIQEPDSNYTSAGAFVDSCLAGFPSPHTLHVRFKKVFVADVVFAISSRVIVKSGTWLFAYRTSVDDFGTEGYHIFYDNSFYFVGKNYLERYCHLLADLK